MTDLGILILFCYEHQRLRFTRNVFCDLSRCIYTGFTPFPGVENAHPPDCIPVCSHESQSDILHS